ncbi:7 transmembrane receptor (Secretin family) domain-containing protein [Phthorimaea operculella]|nr:7 transmembrane receptor (Secretin family) domain-containing protein [Phthorimaea operculella]
MTSQDTPISYNTAIHQSVIAILPAIAWAVVMSYYDDHSCWLVYTVQNIQWILDAPRVAILLINTVLFADVLRVLLTQVRNTENVNQLSTAKATLFLMPIFGLQFILTAFRPNTNNCTGEQAYYYISYTVESLQGFIVAMLYCYVNKEVHTLVKATYKKAENAVVSRVRRDTVFHRPSTAVDSERKLTNSTALTATDTYKEPATILPRLHVAEIISIQASERLADILEPVYETVDFGVTNEGYDALERSDADNDSGFIPNRAQEELYGFTNASSMSIDCQEWIQPNESESENSLVDFHTKDDHKDTGRNNPEELENQPVQEPPLYSNVDHDTNATHSSVTTTYDAVSPEDMLGEIMQYMENSEISRGIMLDPTLLMPNREDDDIVFFEAFEDACDDEYGERVA